MFLSTFSNVNTPDQIQESKEGAKKSQGDIYQNGHKIFEVTKYTLKGRDAPRREGVMVEVVEEGNFSRLDFLITLKG